VAIAGRKTKRTPAAEQVIIERIRTGSTIKDACTAAGISDQTYLNWTHDSLDFLESVTRAEAECAAEMAASIHQAATVQKDWRAAESWLKRRRRNEWGDNVAVRADTEALAIIADLFPAGSGADTREAEGGEAEAAG
jgi:hypothetical protein